MADAVRPDADSDPAGTTLASRVTLPAAPFTSPSPPTDALGPWRSRHLKQLARKLLDWPHPLPPWGVSAWLGVRDALAEILRREPGVFLSALAVPTVGAPLAAGDLLGAMPHLLLDLARRRLLGEQGLFWGAPVNRLVSPFLGADRRFSPPLVGVLFENGVVSLRPPEEWRLEAEPTRRSWPLKHGGWLLGADTNPLASLEAHPDKSGNNLDFGDAPVDSWLASINTARDRIARYAPELAAEHATLLAGIVPVGTPGEVSLSASYQEAIGLVYLSLNANSLTMTEALVHEVQHNKLNLLAWSDAIIENSEENYASPVRPDPRPLWGVLLAVHAFLPVARIHRAMLEAGDPEADPRRYADVSRVNHDGMAVLRAHAKPTPFGAAIVGGMDRLEAALWAEFSG